MSVPRQLPNAITIVRILCAPVFLWMLLADGGADGALRWWAAVLFIVTAASIFAWLLTVSQAAQALTDLMLGITQNKWVFLLLANILILFVGCFIDTIAAITILVPILLPIAAQLGIDPVHFGLVMVLNLMIGLLHPPMGMVLFVLARVAELSFERTTMAILPWLVPLLVSLAVITYMPGLVLWLPRLLM